MSQVRGGGGQAYKAGLALTDNKIKSIVIGQTQAGKNEIKLDSARHKPNRKE